MELPQIEIEKPKIISKVLKWSLSLIQVVVESVPSEELEIDKLQTF